MIHARVSSPLPARADNAKPAATPLWNSGQRAKSAPAAPAACKSRATTAPRCAGRRPASVSGGTRSVSVRRARAVPSVNAPRPMASAAVRGARLQRRACWATTTSGSPPSPVAESTEPSAMDAGVALARSARASRRRRSRPNKSGPTNRSRCAIPSNAVSDPECVPECVPTPPSAEEEEEASPARASEDPFSKSSRKSPSDAKRWSPYVSSRASPASGETPPSFKRDAPPERDAETASPSLDIRRARGSSAPRLGDAARQDAPVAAHRRRLKGVATEKPSRREERAAPAPPTAAAARSSRPTSAYARGGQRGGGRSRHRRRQSRSLNASPLGTRASSARPNPAETIASAVAAARLRAASRSPRAAARAEAAAPEANETQSAAHRTAGPAARDDRFDLDSVVVLDVSVSIASGPASTRSSATPRIGTISARTSGGTSASHRVSRSSVPENRSSSAAHTSGASATPPGALAAHVPALASADAARRAVARSIPWLLPEAFSSKKKAFSFSSLRAKASSNQASRAWWSRNAAASAATPYEPSAAENCDAHAVAARTHTPRRGTRHGRRRTSSLHASYAACAARSKAAARAACAADKRGADRSERGVLSDAERTPAGVFVFLSDAPPSFSLAAAAAIDGYRDASLACRSLRSRYSQASSSSSSEDDGLSSPSPRSGFLQPSSPGSRGARGALSSSARSARGSARLSHPHHARSDVCARSHSSSGDAASAAAERTISIASARDASPRASLPKTQSPPSASIRARVAGETGAPGRTSRTSGPPSSSSAVTRAFTGECKRAMSPTRRGVLCVP